MNIIQLATTLKLFININEYKNIQFQLSNKPNTVIGASLETLFEQPMPLHEWITIFIAAERERERGRERERDTWGVFQPL